MMQSQDQSIIPANISCSLSNGQPVVSSLTVAEVFGKEHYNVLRDIRDLNLDEIDPEFGALNYEGAEYTDEQGKTRAAYNLTEEGFSLLVMGYRGEQAMRFKIAFIREFVRMRNEISRLAAKQAAQDAQHKLMVKEKVRPLDWVQDPHTTFLRLYRNMDRMLDIGHFKHLNPEITTAKDAFNRILSKYESK